MNLFKNEDIAEKKYRLKYKYLIEIEPIIIKILENDSFEEYVNSPSNSTLSQLFNTIFDTIMNSAKPYISHLDIKYHTSYYMSNNIISYEQCEDLKYKCECNMFYEIIKNHCIINGFMSSLQSSNDNTIALRGMYDYYNKQPESIKTQYKHSGKLIKNNLAKQNNSYSDKTISQKYNKALSDIKGTYIDTILNRNFISIDNNDFFTLSSSFSEIYRSFFIEDSDILSNIKKMLSQSCNKEKFAEYYNSIISYCNKKLQSYDAPSDMLLFRAFVELFFGFENFNYLLSNSNTTYQPFIEKELLDTELFNIINECPAPFLKNYLVYMTAAYTPDIDSLKHYINSFRSINTLTIPVLEDLWIITIQELFNIYTYNTDNHDLAETSNIYREYINANYIKLVEPPTILLTKLNRLEYEINSVANSIDNIYTIFKNITSYLNKICPEDILNVNFITPEIIIDKYNRIDHDKTIVLTTKTITQFKNEKLSKEINKCFSRLTELLFNLFNINSLDNITELSMLKKQMQTNSFSKDYKNLYLLGNLFASEALIKHNNIFYYIYSTDNFNDPYLYLIKELFNTSSNTSLKIHVKRTYKDDITPEIREYNSILAERKKTISFKNIDEFTSQDLSLDSLEEILPPKEKIDDFTKNAISCKHTVTKKLKEIKGILNSAEELYNENNYPHTNYKVNPKNKSTQYALKIDSVCNQITSSITNIRTLIDEINLLLKNTYNNTKPIDLTNTNQLSKIDFNPYNKRNHSFVNTYISEYNTKRTQHFDNINTLPMFNNSHVEYYKHTLYKRQKYTHDYLHLLTNYYLN